MDDNDEAAEPGSYRGVGYKFRRPLTDAELESITVAARTRGKNGGLDGAVRATWDIILTEAEGVTMAEATRRGLRFHPGEYAIPESQGDVLLGIWRRYRGPRYPNDVAVSMTWLSVGPGTYPDSGPGTGPGDASDTTG